MKIKKTKIFWVYIVVGFLLTILSVMLAPIWNSFEWAFFKDWGMSLLNLFIAACLCAYLFTYLFKKIKKADNNTNLILLLVEFIFIAMIAVGLVLTQFKIINIGGACQILGVVLWLRGSVEIFRAYYFRGTDTNTYPAYLVAVAIGLVTLGTWLFVKPLIQDIVILWIFVILLLFTSIILIAYGFASKPAKKKKK